MTADLLDEDTPDAEDFCCSWLAPLLRTATERRTDDELPFCVVTRIAGADDAHTGTDTAVVQLDVYDGARDGMVAAQAAALTARDVHRRMTLLARELTTVTLSTGALANADYVDTVIKPFRMDYANERVRRYTARYELGLSYVAV